MGLSERLRTFLDRNAVSVRTITHPETHRAQAVAVAAAVPSGQEAKVVVVRDLERRYLMLVLPAACRLDLQAVRDAGGTGRLELASEQELEALFPDCEIGAMPPFGNLYGLPVYVDRCFSREREVFFEAGNHHEVVGMPYEAYERLVTPVVGEFCLHERGKAADG